MLLCSARAVAQEPSPADWRRFGQLSDQCTNLFNTGRTDLTAAAAEQTKTFVQQRFPPRLQFFAVKNLASARTLEMKYQEAIDLYQQVFDVTRTYRAQSDTEAALVVIHIEEALRSTAYCLSRLGKTEEAIPYLETCLNYIRKNDNKDPLIAANCQKQLAFMYRDAEKWEPAEQTFREAAAVFEREQRLQRRPIDNYPHLLSGWAVMYQLRGRSDLAEPMFRRALKMQVALTGEQHTMVAEFASNLGMIYVNQGRFVEGYPYLQTALKTWEQLLGPEHVLTMIAVHRLAMVQAGMSNFTDAEQLWRRSVAVHLKYLGAEHRDTIDQQLCLAYAIVSQKRFTDAEPLLRESLAAIEKSAGPDSPRNKEAMSQLAFLKIQQEDYAAALPYLERLEKLYELYPPSSEGLAHLNQFKATVHWNLNQRELALQELARALDLREMQRGTSGGTEVERAVDFAMFSMEYELMASWQAELGNSAEMFRTLERTKARSFLDELNLRNVDIFATLSAAQRQSMKQRETQLRQEVLQHEKALDALVLTGEASASHADQQKLADELRKSREALYEFLSDSRSASPIYRKLISNETKPATLAALQQRLGEGELVLAYFIGKWKYSYVLVIQHDSIDVTRLEVDQASAKQLGIETGPLQLQKLTSLLLNEGGILNALSRPGKTDASKSLYELWRVLVPEKTRAALTSGSVKLLTILPDSTLALLPFESLVISGAGTNDPQYLLDAGPPIAYAPSATVLLNLVERQAPTESLSKPVFTLGDPDYARTNTVVAADSGNAGQVRAADRFRAGLSRLPYTGWESTWVDQMFGKAGLATLRVTGAAATEAAIRQNAPGREIIHLACHGMADQSYGNFFGALAVTPGRSGDPSDDGFLSMAEISQLKLDSCELAILSACETNYGPQQEGEGVWALSRGFLVAGARRVIASNWVVDDQAGATLVSYFATYLTRDGKDASARDYAKSLHEAKKQIRKEEKWAHPFYWSSLVLMGPK